MIAHRDIDSAMDAKLEAWAHRIHHEIGHVRDQNHQLEGFVTQLREHITGLELKIDYLSNTQKAQPKRFEADIKKLDKKFTSHMNNIESFCGFSDPLGDGSEYYISPEYKICNRLDSMEKVLGKVNSDVARYEKRSSTEHRYQLHSNRGNTHRSSPSPPRRSRSEQQAFYPQPQQNRSESSLFVRSPREQQQQQPQSPRDKVSSPRGRSRSPRPPSPCKPSTRNPYGAGVYTPSRKTSLHVNNINMNMAATSPRPPSSQTGPPPPLHSRPYSAPTGPESHKHKQNGDAITESPFNNDMDMEPSMLKKVVPEIYRHIGEVDAKNDKQNMCLLNELMDNFQLHDEKHQAYLGDMQRTVQTQVRDLEQRLRGVQGQLRSMETEVKQSLQTKFRQIDRNIQAIKQQQTLTPSKQQSRPQAVTHGAGGEEEVENGAGLGGSDQAEAKPSPSVRKRESKQDREHGRKKGRGSESKNPGDEENSSASISITDEEEEEENLARVRGATGGLSSREVDALVQEGIQAEARKTKQLESDKAALQAKIKAETMKTTQLYDAFEGDKAALHVEFAQKETVLKSQIEDEKRKTAQMHEKFQTDQELYDQKIAEIESDYQGRFKEEARKNEKRLAKLQKKFDKFIKNQIDVMGGLEKENMQMVSSQQQGTEQLDLLEANTQLSAAEKTSLITILEKETLLTVFDQTGGGVEWDDTFLWSRDEPITSWLAVEVAQSRVTGLHLGSNRLTGTIPEALSQLQHLTDLQLFGNFLHGSLPACLGQLTRLQSLLLSQNQLTGDIPSALSKCVLLEEIDFSDNQLSGRIPSGLAIATLTSLSLHHNQLEGPLPRSFTTLRWLQHLSADQLPLAADDKPDFYKVHDYINAHADDNGDSDDNKSQVSDNYDSNMLEEQDNLLTIIEGFGGDAARLNWTPSAPSSAWEGVSFDRQGCVRSLILTDHNPPLEVSEGVFPEALEFLSNVLFLDLSHNELSGDLPREVCNLAHLQFLYLNNNALEGELGPDIEKLASLKTLNLSGNQLTGQLEPSLSALQELEILCLSNNSLEGIIPEELFNLSKLRVFDVSSNNLTGIIPDNLGKLLALEALDVSGNQLEGVLPASVGSLQALRHLDLSFNTRLSSDLPSAMTQLTHLTELNIQMTGGASSGVGDGMGGPSATATLTPHEEEEETSGGAGNRPVVGRSTSVEFKRKTILKKLPSLNKISL